TMGPCSLVSYHSPFSAVWICILPDSSDDSPRRAWTEPLLVSHRIPCLSVGIIVLQGVVCDIRIAVPRLWVFHLRALKRRVSARKPSQPIRVISRSEVIKLSFCVALLAGELVVVGVITGDVQWNELHVVVVNRPGSRDVVQMNSYLACAIGNISQHHLLPALP